MGHHGTKLLELIVARSFLNSWLANSSGWSIRWPNGCSLAQPEHVIHDRARVGSAVMTFSGWTLPATVANLAMALTGLSH